MNSWPRRFLPIAIYFLAVGALKAGDAGRFGDEVKSGMPYANPQVRDAKVGAWESAPPEQKVTIENANAKLTVWPEAGGAITEYLNKLTGTNFVAGAVQPGKGVFGWKDVVRPDYLEAPSKQIAALPHRFRRVQTPAGAGIEVIRSQGGVESRRVIVLDPDSAKVTVSVRLTNVSAEPQRLFPRWHAYSMVGDPVAESSGIYFPLRQGNLGKIRLGVGFDNTFLDPEGYVLAANAKTGEGLWMTFDPKDVSQVTSHTNAKWLSQPPMRGAFTVEPWLEPGFAQPGEAMEITYCYFPFTKETSPEALPLDLIPVGKLAENARRFARLVKPNLELLWNHTMTPTESNAGQAEVENRFYHWVTRPDRMALRDWGIADALFSMPGIQEMKARVRYAAQLFPTAKTPVDLEFAFFIEDALGKRVLQDRQPVSLSPEQPVSDLWRDYDLSSVPDGCYRVGVEVWEKGSDQPIHRHTEDRVLVGDRRVELAKSRPDPLAERPFVKALRSVDFSDATLEKLRIPIGVEEASGVDRKAWPVFAGVPFAKGMIQPDTPLRLLNPGGKEVAFDRAVSGTWDDGSVRWLLLNFAADVPADGFAFYHLESCKSGLPEAGQLLGQSGATITFDNGSQRWQWAGEQRLGPITAEDLWWTNGDGRRYVFRLRGEGAGIEIEENGTCRAVVKATGWYFAEGDDEPVARGIVRFEGYRSQPQLRISHNVMFAGNPWKQTLRGFGLNLPLSGDQSGPFKLLLDGKTVEAKSSFTLSQVDDETCRLVVDGTEQIGQRAEGVFAFPLGSATRTVVFRDFWRLFPKEVSMAASEAGKVTLSYWPESGPLMNFIPEGRELFPQGSAMEDIAVGMSRTHEIILVDGPARDLAATQHLFDEPVLAIVPPAYLARTKTMMHLQPYDPEKSPEVERIISETFDSYILQQDLWGWRGAWVYGALPNMFLTHEYRWMDYGRARWILNEMDIVQTPWLAYMRSGDRKYFKFAEANTRQLEEVSTIHWNQWWPEYVGMSRRHNTVPWFGLGDSGHSMLDPFLERYRMTGERSAWEAAGAMADAMARLKSGDYYKWRYVSNPLAGLSRMYLETQHPKYKREADRLWQDLCRPAENEWYLADHGDRAAMYYSKINPECAALVKEWTLKVPNRFTGMDILSMLYLETQDVSYADAALTQFRTFATERNSRTKDDPLMLGLSRPTQFTLTPVRQMMYAGSTLDAAGQAAPKPATPPTP